MKVATLEKVKQFEEKQKQLLGIFEEAGEDLDLSKVKSIEGTTAEKRDYIKGLNDELNEIGTELKALRDLEKAEADAKGWTQFNTGVPEPSDGEKSVDSMKTFGERFIESPAYKHYKQRVESNFEMSSKALFQTTAGFQPEVTRTGVIVPTFIYPLTILDIVPQIPTGQAGVKYMEETTYTNVAAEVLEGGGNAGTPAGSGVNWPEAELAFTERDVPVRRIATWLPVTDEQLEDVAGIGEYVNSRLIMMLKTRLNNQMLNGDGTAPNLLGIRNVVGVGSQAKGADAIPTAIHGAMTNVLINGGIPSGTVMHPNDWHKLRTLQTADGLYIYGHPAESDRPMLWGTPIVQSIAISEGEALVGDFMSMCALYDRRDVSVLVSNSHGEFFTRGRQAIRADLRAAMVVYRPAAFRKVTGLNA